MVHWLALLKIVQYMTRVSGSINVLSLSRIVVEVAPYPLMIKPLNCNAYKLYNNLPLQMKRT